MEVSIQIERKRYDDRHLVRPSPPNTNTNQMYRVYHNGEEIGVWRDPECSAARKLVEMGYSRSDVLCSFRDSTPSMRGRLGWFADRRAQEDDRGPPRFVKWTPMPELR